MLTRYGVFTGDPGVGTDSLLVTRRFLDKYRYLA